METQERKNVELKPGEKIMIGADRLIHVDGLPFTLKAGAELSGTPENWELLRASQESH